MMISQRFNHFDLHHFDTSSCRSAQAHLGNYLLAELAALKPKAVAAMHGSSFVGDGEKALLDLGPVLKAILGN
jgi:hypothetical protein